MRSADPGLCLAAVDAGLRAAHAVRSGRDTRITLVVQARGDAPELENLLRGALWLRESGTLMADVLLVDCGLTEEAAALAERLARRREDLKLCNTEEICQWMQTPIQ